MSKVSRRIEVLESQGEQDLKRIREVEEKLEIKTRVKYGDWYPFMVGSGRSEVEVVDVVKSILSHLQLEIAHKKPVVTTETMVKLVPIKKKMAKKRKTSLNLKP